MNLIKIVKLRRMNLAEFYQIKIYNKPDKNEILIVSYKMNSEKIAIDK